MPIFKPFRAWLPRHPHQVCLPLGSYSQKKIESLRHEQPDSFLNVVFPPGTTKSRPDWQLSRQAWESFKATGRYSVTEREVFFVYIQEDHGRRFSGLIGLASTSDFEANRIKKHEDTLREKEKTLFHYLQITRIQAEPVYLLFEDDARWHDIMAKAAEQKSWIDFFDELGRHHILIPCLEPDLIENIKDYCQCRETFYIADGHHRCAASTLFGRQYAHRGSAGLFMAALLPLSQVHLEPFSRLIAPFQGAPEIDEIRRKLSVHFYLEGPLDQPVPEAYANLCLEGHWYPLTPIKNPELLFGLMGKVPPFVLNELVFKPVFEISDFRGDKRLRYIGGKPDYAILRKEVATGKAFAALTMQPLSVQHFREVSDAHLSMPPKSTWFLPKFLTGLTVFEYADETF
jgi:uncharacterized protein (DUF1015 family)